MFVRVRKPGSIYCDVGKGRDRFVEGPDFNEEYLKRLIDEDAATVRHFIAYFTRHLRIKLRSRLRSAQLIDDVMQETFLRFFKALRGSRPVEQPDRLGAFLNGICNLVLLENFRTQVKYQGTGFDAPEQGDTSWDPDAAFVTADRKQQVREVLAEMPERERRLLQLMFLEDRDKDEICREFGVDREYLRVLLHRAKNRARGIFIRQAGAGG